MKSSGRTAVEAGNGLSPSTSASWFKLLPYQYLIYASSFCLLKGQFDVVNL